MRKSTPIFWTVLSGLRVAMAIAACIPVGAAFAQSSPQAGSGASTGAGYGSGNGQGRDQGGSAGAKGGSSQAAGQPSSGGYAGQGAGKSGSGGHEGGQPGSAGMHGSGGYGSPHVHDFHAGFHGGFDRSNPRWWQGRQEFSGYAGHRAGFFFAPGFGYRPVPSAYAGRPWVVGAVVPPELRSYQVVDPTVYGVAPAPAGHRWIYVDDGVALIETGHGVIVQSVGHIW